jgi:hypothetical protein
MAIPLAKPGESIYDGGFDGFLLPICRDDEIKQDGFTITNVGNDPLEEDGFPMTNVGNDDWEGIPANPTWFHLGTDPSLLLRMTIWEIPANHCRNDGGRWVSDYICRV